MSAHPETILESPSELDQTPISRLGLSLFVILSGSFLAPLLMHSSTLAIPTIATELRLSAELVSWFTLVQVLSNACFVLPAGKLADKYGRRFVFTLGLLTAAIACFIGGVSESGLGILICRALQGVGTAFIFSSAVALVMTIPPPHLRVRIMGIYISIAYLGIVMGPVFGGYVIEAIHWRWVFLIPGALLLLIGILGFVFLHWERYGDRNTRLRALDTTLYMGALTMIAFGIFETAHLGGKLLLLSGVLSFAAFFWFQTKRRDPLLQVSLFLNNRTFCILGIAHLLNYSAILALPFTLTLYLQYIKALDAQTTGYVLLTQALFTVVVAPFSGWLSDRIRPRYLIFSGIGLFLIASIMLTAISMDSPVTWVLIALGLIGTSVGIMDAPLLHTCMSTVEARLLGSASATMNGLRMTGGFVGMGVISYLIGLHLGDQEIQPHLYDELMLVLQQFYLVAAGLAVASLVLLVVGVVTRPKPA